MSDVRNRPKQLTKADQNSLLSRGEVESCGEGDTMVFKNRWTNESLTIAMMLPWLWLKSRLH